MLSPKAGRIKSKFGRVKNLMKSKKRAFSPPVTTQPLVKMMQNYTIKYINRIISPRYQDSSAEDSESTKLPEIISPRNKKDGFLSQKSRSPMRMISNTSFLNSESKRRRVKHDFSEFINDEELCLFRNKILSDYQSK